MDAAEGACDHRRILPIRYPARNASPTIAASTNAANAKTRQPVANVRHRTLFILGQIGQEVEGAGDEERPPERPGSALAPGPGRRLASTCAEVRLGAARPGRPRRVRGRSTSAWRSSRSPSADERREHPVDVLVGEDRGDEDVVGALGSRASSVPDAVEVVRAVPDLGRPATLEPARQLDVDVARPTAGRGTPPPPRARRRCGDRRGRRTIARELLPRARRGRPSRPAARPRASRARSPPASSPRTSVCSSATFVSTTTRAIEDVRRVVRPPSPASTTATSTPAAANSASAAAVSTSNCVAPTARRAARTRPTAVLEVGLGAADADPLAPGAHVRREVRADRSGPRARAAPRSCASPSTCRSCRRRGSTDSALRVAEVAQQRRDPVEPEPVLRPRATATRPSSTAERIELPPVALELLAARRRRRRPARSGRSARSRACPSARAISLRSRSISAAALPFRFARARAARPPRRCAAPRPRAGHARRCGGTSPPPPARAAARPPPRRRPPPATARRSAAISRSGRFVQISSVTCGMAGWSSLSSRSSAAVAVARASASPS